MKVMMVFNALSSFMALFAVIVLYAAYLGTPEAKRSIYVAGAFCSAIAVHQMISFAFALEFRLRSRRTRKGLPGYAGNTEPVGQLDERDTRQILDLPSVTENTTEILRDAPRRSAITKPQG